MPPPDRRLALVIRPLRGPSEANEFRESGLKLVLRTWPTVEILNARRITSTMVEGWLVDFKAYAAPTFPTEPNEPQEKAPAPA
ncbi:hypothetical protein DB346_24500 [Verrucomicrobia bacterium LW23]|nr:hypothetical protein DB346_24500 [Verrucomicrobia bacterium LW23]